MYLEVKPGEAVVIRNIGGRITPGLLEQLSLLWMVMWDDLGRKTKSSILEFRASTATVDN
jgi:hypothetical protein